jgi:CLIP-associating protein 1/2
MSNPDDWEMRLDACTRLQGLALGGACELESFPEVFRKSVRDPLAQLLQDLRSSIFKAACAAIGEISRALGDGFEAHAAHFLPLIWIKTVVSIQVIADAADECVSAVLRHTQAPRLLPRILEGGTADRNGRIRATCMGYLALCLQHWSEPALARAVGAMDDAIRRGFADASGEARSAARRCFWAFKPRWPERAQALMDTLEPSTQRLLLAEEQGPTTPTHGSYTRTPGVSILCCPFLTEIYRCHTCSCHEILRMETPGQAGARPAVAAARGGRRRGRRVGVEAAAGRGGAGARHH